MAGVGHDRRDKLFRFCRCCRPRNNTWFYKRWANKRVRERDRRLTLVEIEEKEGE